MRTGNNKGFYTCSPIGYARHKAKPLASSLFPPIPNSLPPQTHPQKIENELLFCLRPDTVPTEKLIFTD